MSTHFTEAAPRRALYFQQGGIQLMTDAQVERFVKRLGAYGYTVIDPKGMIGNPVFDLSRFILDEFRDDLTAEPRDVIMNFIKAIL